MTSNIVANNTNDALLTAITGLQKSALAKMANNAGLNFTANALRHEGLSGEFHANQVNMFNDILSSAVGQSDIISKLRSFGVPLAVKDTPKKSKSVGPNGIAIAPNILKKMEQDEEYAQEILGEISNFMYNVLPAAEQNYAMQGAKIKWYGISIDADGLIKSWTGAVHIDEDEGSHSEIEVVVFTGGGKNENYAEISHQTISPNIDNDIDWLAYLSLVGDTSYKEKRTS